MSGSSMTTQKSLNCWPVMVQKPTQPSLAGSTEGISMERVAPVRASEA